MEEEDSDEDSEASTDSEEEEDWSEKKKKKKNKSKEQTKKEKSSSKKEKKQGKQEITADSVSKMIQDKLQTIGMSQFGMTEKPYCQVCQRFGHLYDNCYYNPEFRGRRPEYITQKMREVAANVIAPQGANRRYQGSAPPRRFQNPNNWGYQNRGQNIVHQLPCTYCGTIGHIGRDLTVIYGADIGMIEGYLSSGITTITMITMYHLHKINNLFHNNRDFQDRSIW